MVTKKVVCKLTYATLISKLNLEHKEVRYRDTNTRKHVDT